MYLMFTADSAFRRGDYDTARSSLSESLTLVKEIGDLTNIIGSLVGLGRLACVDGDYARARALVEEGLAISRRPDFDNPRRIAVTLITLGEIARCEGDPARGALSFDQALATGRELGEDMIVGTSLHNLGHVALHAGDLGAAAARFRESLLLRLRLGPGYEVASALAGVAGLALHKGQLTEAVRLFGAAAGMLESGGFVLPQADELVRRADLSAIHSRLDDAAFDAAFSEGHAAKFEDLEAMADAVMRP
jgi:tetratricopeptide (TPR) repeat protein